MARRTKHPITERELKELESATLTKNGGTVSEKSEIYRLARIGLAAINLGLRSELWPRTDIGDKAVLEWLNHPAWLKGE